MKRPSNIEVLQALLERKPAALEKAAEAEAQGRAGKALYYRTIAQQSDMIYAWMVGDDARTVLTDQDKRALEKHIATVDEQMLQYRIAVARAAVEAA